MKRIAMTLLCLGAASCSGSEQDRTEQEIQQAVRESLIDPNSAQFGETVMSSNRNYACVNVNARNQLGGYTGTKQVIVGRMTGGGPTWAYLGDASELAHMNVTRQACLDWINRMETSAPVTSLSNTGN